MHIALDISPLKSGHQDRGVGRYTEQLIKSLQQYDKVNSYHFFTRGQKIPNIVDLVHYPYFDPFFLTMPWFPNQPVVVTVHDLIPIAFLEKFHPGRRGKLKWNIQRLLLQKAKQIITDSEASARDITRFCNISSEKISVIYLASTLNFPKKTNSKVVSENIRKKYRLSKYFFLYVGDVNWNKNILGLLRGFALFNKGLAKQLVLVGKAFQNLNLPETREVLDLIKQLNLEKNVILPGFVSDKDLAGLYGSATGYIQASFAEGFGLSVIDAMTYNCPVITSAVSSLEEIAGPAIRIDPYDTNSISLRLTELMNYSLKSRNDLIKAQKLWVENFSWEKVAENTVKVYEKVLARK